MMSKSMELIILTNQGLENLASKEVQELIKKKSKVYPSLVYLEADEKESIQLIHHLQSSRRILFSLGSFTDLNKLSFKDLLLYSCSFRFRIGKLHRRIQPAQTGPAQARRKFRR